MLVLAAEVNAHDDLESRADYRRISGDNAAALAAAVLALLEDLPIGFTGEGWVELAAAAALLPDA
jgi:hypothetical protein